MWNSPFIKGDKTTHTDNDRSNSSNYFESLEWDS